MIRDDFAEGTDDKSLSIDGLSGVPDRLLAPSTKL
jgi:hypothetical protein